MIVCVQMIMQAAIHRPPNLHRHALSPLRPGESVGIFIHCVETTEPGPGLLLLDPTRRGDTTSHQLTRRSHAATRHVEHLGLRVTFDALRSKPQPSAYFSSAVLIVTALFGAAGCSTSALARPVESTPANASLRGAIPSSAEISTPSSPAPRPQIETVDTRSAVAAWRSPTAHIDIEILANTSRCSAEMALVNGRVCVDRWEGSLVERPGNGQERQWSPYQPIDGMESRVRAVSRPGVIPQGYISGEQAERACAASGKRLCSAEEWELACRGSRQTQFPYGNNRKGHVCNDDNRAKHPVVEVGMLLGIPESRLWYDGMNQPLINQLPDSLLETGARTECTNDYGVFDMVGNLHEWINDPSGTFRGGYYMDTTRNGDGCSYATTAHGFTYHDYSTGFRCCADPDHVE